MEIFLNHQAYPLVKDIFTFILTVTGLVIASQGLATWKKQIKGTKEFEAAHDLSYSVLRVRDAIKRVRHPAIFPSENHRAGQYIKTKYPDRVFEDTDKNSNQYVYEMRWEEIADASVEMESHLLMAEVLWGPKILALVKLLNQKITELNINLQQYFQPELRTKDLMEINSVVYGRIDGDEKDVFAREVNLVVERILEFIKTKIS